MTELSDELLVAYVDGQLARDQSRAIKRVLDHDDVAAARVEALRTTQRRLEAAFDAMLADELNALTGSPGAEPPLAPAPIPQYSRRQSGRKWPAVAACAAFVLLAVGAWAPYFVPLGELLPVGSVAQPAADPMVTAAIPQPPIVRKNWPGDMAAGHALMARETLEVSPASQSNSDLAYFQLSKAIGKSLVIPDLAPQGLTFRRAQLLRREGVPVAEIAYLPGDGPPVALYAKSGDTTDSPFTFDVLDGAAVVNWQQNGISLVLAGVMQKEKMEQVAAAVYDQMAAAANQPLPEPPAQMAPETKDAPGALDSKEGSSEPAAPALQPDPAGRSQ